MSQPEDCSVGGGPGRKKDADILTWFQAIVRGGVFPVESSEVTFGRGLGLARESSPRYIFTESAPRLIQSISRDVRLLSVFCLSPSARPICCPSLTARGF